MDNTIYAVFIMLNGFAIGASLIGVYFESKLSHQALTRMSTRKHLYAAIGKAGFAITGIILMLRVIALGAIEASFYSWLYTLGLAVAGFGFAGASGVAADQLAESEIDEGRFQHLEHRVDVEELRNTDIEELAKAHAAEGYGHHEIS